MPNSNFDKTIDFGGQKFYIGLDVHKESWTVTVRSLGRQVAHFTQPPGARFLIRTLSSKFPGGDYYSAYEAGFCGTVHHEQLLASGINNIIVHAADVPSTDKQKKNKTDTHDSRAIATHLERQNLRGIHVLPREQQELRSLFRLRESVVKDVTRANNRLKGFLFYHHIQLPESVKKKERLSKKALDWLDNLELFSEAGTITKNELISVLRYQREREYKITKLLRVQIQGRDSQAYKHLLSVPGIGSVTAMALLAEIGHFPRFDNPNDYTSYLGLTPWCSSSGNTVKTKGIQPRCNTHLRPLLVEASWTAIRVEPKLFAYYSKHAAKNNKHAIIKVAKKLALAARAVVLAGKPYDSNYSLENNLQKRFLEVLPEQHIKQTSGIRHEAGLPDE